MKKTICVSIFLAIGFITFKFIGVAVAALVLASTFAPRSYVKYFSIVFILTVGMLVSWPNYAEYRHHQELVSVAQSVGTSSEIPIEVSADQPFILETYIKDSDSPYVSLETLPKFYRRLYASSDNCDYQQIGWLHSARESSFLNSLSKLEKIPTNSCGYSGGLIEVTRGVVGTHVQSVLKGLGGNEHLAIVRPSSSLLVSQSVVDNGWPNLQLGSIGSLADSLIPALVISIVIVALIYFLQITGLSLRVRRLLE